jgi:hypothetical protein
MDAPRVAVFVSEAIFEPVGAEVTLTAAVNEAFVASGACVAVIVVSDTAPTREGEDVPADKAVGVTAPALAGATDVRTPKPREATATSATRLKVVFVDICFLSISRVREFPDLGFG